MTVSAPVRDLLQLALGSFPRSQEENDRSRALLRCAYRGRTRKVRLSIVENCGGKGGKPGPCPDPSSEEGGSGSGTIKDKNGVSYPVKFDSRTRTYYIGVPGKEDLLERGVTAGSAQMKANGVSVSALGIHPEFRRKGLATALYDHIEKHIGRSLLPNSALTDDGVAFWKSRQKPTANARPLKTDIRIKELAPYLHDMLGDVTKRDARAIARIVKRGVERRWKDSSVARAIVRSTKIEPDRAKVIARTEMSRARTDVGLGKKRDSDKVVFTIGAVDRTCPRCRALEGKVYTVRKAAGVIPVHPNCRCFWSDAPKGARVSNVFCATGEGGGVDPSCGADGSKGSRVGAKFASMPSGKATSKESKKWRKDNQKNYDEDPEFRAVADSVALYTQGDYNVQRAFAQRAVTGRLPAEYEDSAIPGWVDKKMHGSALANYKTYFSGQEWMTDRGDSSVTYAQAGRALTNAVADSPPIPTSLYRGLEGRRATLSVKDLKPGDDFDILAPTSFTSDETIGQEFARGVAKGQGRKREESEDGVIFEVLPGARGLPVSAISPWDQKEVLTSGKFKVKEVRRNGREPVHVVLEQVSVHRALLTTNSVGGSKEETEVVRLLAKRTRPFPHQF